MCKSHGDTGVLCVWQDRHRTERHNKNKTKPNNSTESPCQHSHPPSARPAPPPHPTQPLPARQRVGPHAWAAQGLAGQAEPRRGGQGPSPQRQTQGRYYLGEGRAAPRAGGGEAASSCQLSSPLFLLWAESYSELTETLSSSIWKDKTIS